MQCKKDCKKFKYYLEDLKQTSNKVGFLVDAFKEIHSDIPSEDLEINITGGKIAQLWKLCNKDSGKTLQLIWKSSSDNPVGSHLDYMLGIVKRDYKNNTQQKQITNTGKYRSLD